jgi:hypothetical protein
MLTVNRMLTQPSQLPPELLHEILGYLRGDTKALCAASLASSVMRGICQGHLFSVISLDRRGHKRPGATTPSIALAEVYRHSPELLAHVQTVKSCDSEKHIRGVSMCHSYPLVLTLLASQAVQHLQLGPWIWQTLWEPRVVDAFVSLIQCPTLLTLQLDSMPIQLATAIRSPVLRELYLGTTRSEERWPDLSSVSSIAGRGAEGPLRSVRVLSIHAEAQAIAFALEGCFRSLRSLTLKLGASPGNDIWRLIENCAEMLETFRLDARSE